MSYCLSSLRVPGSRALGIIHWLISQSIMGKEVRGLMTCSFHLNFTLCSSFLLLEVFWAMTYACVIVSHTVCLSRHMYNTHYLLTMRRQCHFYLMNGETLLWVLKSCMSANKTNTQFNKRIKLIPNLYKQIIGYKHSQNWSGSHVDNKLNFLKNC